jgi:hypothetical protein
LHLAPDHLSIPLEWATGMAAEFTITAVVVCDEIRKEITGKDILIGTYGGSILVPTIPVNLPISIWVEFVPHVAGRLSMEVRMRLPGNPVFPSMGVIMDIARAEETTSFSSPQAACYVAQPGDIRIEIRSSSTEEWQLAKVKHIALGAANVPTSSPEARADAPSDVNAPLPRASPSPFEQSPSAAPASAPSRVHRRPSSRRSARTPKPE